MQRSYLLSIDFKVTSLTEWAAQLKMNPLYAILSGFDVGNTPGVGTFYDFFNRLWDSDEDHMSPHIHPLKTKVKKPKTKADPVEKVTVVDLLPALEKTDFKLDDNETLVSANSYTLTQAISIAIVSGWANALNPSFLQVPMMYDNTKVMKRAAVISCTMAFFTYLFMTATGPLSYIINPGLSHADYSTVYLTASLMPGWMAGIVVSAIFAAIQSSVSAFVLIIAGSITKDLYVDCFGSKAEEKKLKQINMILFAVFCCLCALIALNQNQLGQLLVILSAGGIALSFGVPYFFGVCWGKATAAGALASSVGGVISYIFLYYCSSMQWYQEYLWSINPLIPALIITILLMVGVSLKTACTWKEQVQAVSYYEIS